MAYEGFQYAVTPAVSSISQEPADTLCAESLPVEEFHYRRFEAVQFAPPTASLCGSVDRLPSPLGDGLRVHIKPPSNLANRSMLVVELLSNLQEGIQADHIELKLRAVVDLRNGVDFGLVERELTPLA